MNNKHIEAQNVGPPPEPVSDVLWKEIFNLQTFSRMLTDDPVNLSTGQLRWIYLNKRDQLSNFMVGCILAAFNRRIWNSGFPGRSEWVSNEILAPNSRPSRFIRISNVLQYALPKKTREKMFIPALEDIFIDYLETRSERQPDRLLIGVFFYCRVLMIFAECLARGYSEGLRLFGFR